MFFHYIQAQKPPEILIGFLSGGFSRVNSGSLKDPVVQIPNHADCVKKLNWRDFIR